MHRRRHAAARAEHLLTRRAVVAVDAGLLTVGADVVLLALLFTRLALPHAREPAPSKAPSTPAVCVLCFRLARLPGNGVLVVKATVALVSGAPERCHLLDMALGAALVLRAGGHQEAAVVALALGVVPEPVVLFPVLLAVFLAVFGLHLTAHTADGFGVGTALFCAMHPRRDVRRCGHVVDKCNTRFHRT